MQNVSQESEEKSPFERSRFRWEDNIKTDVRQCVKMWTGFASE
jgi:hypothetical protein